METETPPVDCSTGGALTAGSWMNYMESKSPFASSLKWMISKASFTVVPGASRMGSVVSPGEKLPPSPLERRFKKERLFFYAIE